MKCTRACSMREYPQAKFRSRNAGMLERALKGGWVRPVDLILVMSQAEPGK